MFAGELDPNARFNVLVFSKTAAFRHSSIPKGIAAIQTLGQQNNFTVDATEDASLFTDAFLAHYDVVVFISTTGDVLNDTQQAAFERYIQAGGGYVGIHAAADTEYDWAVVRPAGGRVLPQPPGRHADRDGRRRGRRPSPPRPGLPARWTRVDEWYNYQGRQPGGQRRRRRTSARARSTPIHVLLTMDESTYAEDDGTDGVDDDHPISWCQRYDGGRMWYTALGHTQASFTEPNFLKHLLGRHGDRGRHDRSTPTAVCDPNAAPVADGLARPDAATSAPATRWRSPRARPTPTATRSPTRGTSATASTSTEQNPTHTYTRAGHATRPR